MVYVIVFLAGAVAAASALIIWYFYYVAQLRKERLLLQNWEQRLRTDSSNLTQQSDDLEKRRQQLDEAARAIETRKVQYDDLVKENSFLKQDLFNLSVQLKKTEQDHAATARRQEEMDKRANELAERYLKENVSWIAQKLSSNNFANCKKRLLDVIQRCRDIGFQVPEGEEDKFVQDLKKNFEDAVRAELQRQEQSRIKAQIREEERLAREIEKQIQEAQREHAALQAALEKALKETKDEHSAEVEHLRAKLREAEEKAERAKSRAQMTKSGYVYVISNIGSFGRGVYKIGMTRRLEPMNRVRELGDASVPFPFDVHMMISCDDAPTLENALHRELHRQRVNRVNFRKEFFRVDLESIREVVELEHGEVEYVADPDALEYHESVNMTQEDYEFVEETVQSLTDDEDGSVKDD